MKNRILIADDDRANLSSLAYALELENYDVAVAKSGAEAVKRLLSTLPDLVLLGLEMSAPEGRRVLGAMRLLNLQVPVIVLAEWPHQHDPAIASIDVVMEKALDLPALVEVIATLLLETNEERTLRLGNLYFTPVYIPNANQAMANPPIGDSLPLQHEIHT